MTTIIENIDTIMESSLSNIWSHTQNHECGAISGYRHDNTASANKDNNRDIQAYLKSKQYSVTRVQGNYIENNGGSDEQEVVEPSFFVADVQDTGNLKRDLMTLGKRFDQDSILFVPKGDEGAYLIGTSKRDNFSPGFGKEHVVGDGEFEKAAGIYLSKIRNQTLPCDEVQFPETINGRRGWSILADLISEGCPDFH